MWRTEAVLDSQHNRKNHYALLSRKREPRVLGRHRRPGGGHIRVMPPLRDTEDGVIGLGGALARCDGE